MTNRKIAKHVIGIDSQIETLLGELENYDSYSDEYKSITENIQKLVTMRNDLKLNRIGDKVKIIDLTTVVNGTVSILSLLMILNYEKTEIVTSKAMTVATKWLGK